MKKLEKNIKKIRYKKSLCIMNQENQEKFSLWKSWLIKKLNSQQFI